MLMSNLLVALVIVYTRLNSLQALAKLSYLDDFLSGQQSMIQAFIIINYNLVIVISISDLILGNMKFIM